MAACKTSSAGNQPIEKKLRKDFAVLQPEAEMISLKDTGNLYFNPGCALQLYRPASAERIYQYLQRNFPNIRKHTICCRHDPQLPYGSVIINVCAGCDRRFSSHYEGIFTVSLWEVLCELNNFTFPDYSAMKVSIHDPCPVRNKPAVHRAVRKLLLRMNVGITEAEHVGANSICCGDSLYPDCDMEKIHRAMKKRAESMPCNHVVVYCISCVKAIYNGGKTPRYLVDLLLEETTEPQECDIRKWHAVLDAYIQTH